MPPWLANGQLRYHSCLSLPKILWRYSPFLADILAPTIPILELAKESDEAWTPIHWYVRHVWWWSIWYIFIFCLHFLKEHQHPLSVQRHYRVFQIQSQFHIPIDLSTSISQPHFSSTSSKMQPQLFLSLFALPAMILALPTDLNTAICHPPTAPEPRQVSHDFTIYLTSF
jgi:hypothetical protein